MNNSRFLQQVIRVIWVVVFLVGCARPTATPTPTPTSPPPPASPPPPPPPTQPVSLPPDMEARFGIFESREDLTATQALGVRWSRMQMSWDLVQASQGGAYDWQIYDRAIRASQEAGLFLDLMIFPFAAWDQPACHPEFATDQLYRFPCDVERYRQYVRAVVERYDGDGNGDMPGLLFPVLHYETFNEPSGSGLMPNEYVELLRINYQEVKSACPSCQVLLGGWGNWGGSQQAYLEQVLELGGADSFDIANLHYIQGEGFDGTLAVGEFANVLAARAANKPIWLTEVEIYSGCDGCFTAEQGAAELVKGYVHAFGLGASKLFWGVLAWNSTFPPEMEYALLIDKAGVKLPSYYALRTTIAMLDRFENVDVLLADTDAGQYRFTVGGRPVYVLWGPAALPAEIRGTVRVTDVQGNATEMDAAQLALAAEPVFVEVSPASPPPGTPAPTEPPAQTEPPAVPQSLFDLVKTVQVTPDDNFNTGDFVRVNYIAATDRLVVTFGTRALSQPSGDCTEGGLAYKGYTLEMEETGESGLLNCEMPDFGSTMVDNTYYFVSMHAEEGEIGWRILKYDAVTWESQADIFYPLFRGGELEYRRNGDPMVAYVNGQLDISAGYNLDGAPPPDASHHQFFTTDLEFLEERILSDTAHIDGASMIYLDGVYHFITADAFHGDVVVMQYDQNWKYLGVKTLIKQAHFSTGLAYDGQRFYLAYLDTSQRTDPGFLPVYLNVRLAAFDQEWNLVDDVAVTDYARGETTSPGRPWVILHDNRLYVSYDVGDSAAPDPLETMQAIVSVYELVDGSTVPPPAQTSTPSTTPGLPPATPGAGGTQVLTVAVDAAQTGEPISPYVYGQFIEHQGRCIYGGIWAEMLEDRKFYFPVNSYDGPPGDPALLGSPWRASSADTVVAMDAANAYVGEHSPRITLAGATPGGIVQEGLALRQGQEYTGRIVVRGSGVDTVEVSLVWGTGSNDRDTVSIASVGAAYATTEFAFTAGGDTDDGRLEILGQGAGEFSVGAVSLMPADNVQGMRADTLELLKELGGTVYRWPGGSFVNNYDWQDAVGDPDKRAPFLNDAYWSEIVESNDFGPDEFMTLVEMLDAEAYIAVSAMQLSDAEMAAEEVEYFNGGSDTAMGQLRAANGHPEPYGVKFWGVGNEAWMHYTSVAEYAAVHSQIAAAMLAVDPTLTIIAVGGYAGEGDWSELMLAIAGDSMDLISEHWYGISSDDLAEHTSAIAEGFELQIDAHRQWRQQNPALQDIGLALDEWNYYWGDLPQIYGDAGIRYPFKNALGIAAALHEIYRNSDLVYMANTHPVNVHGHIKTTATEAAFEATALPLIMYRHHFGTLPIPINTDTSPLDVVVAWTEDRQYLTVAVVNPTQDAYALTLELQDAQLTGGGQWWLVASDDPAAYNEPGQPPNVEIQEGSLTGSSSTLIVPASSIILYKLAAR